MKLSKIVIDRIIAISIIILIGVLVIPLRIHFGSQAVLILFTTVFLLHFGNLVLRNFYWSKSWLLSRINIFSSKFQTVLILKLQKEIAFEKFLEVLLATNFQIVKVDNENLEIYARSEFNWLSGGENLYLTFSGKGRESQLSFSSASPRIYDFYNNQENYLKVMNAFDDALTI
jgi:hypothetical protein